MSDPRCPRCGAARRPGDQWCGLCYADFREAPPAVVGDATLPAAGPAPTAPPPGHDAPPLISRPDQPVMPPTPAAPAPVIPPQSAAPTPTQTVSSFVPSTNPLAPTATAPPEAPAAVPPGDPATSAATADAATSAAAAESAAAGEGDPAAELKWPCTGCGAQVPMSEDYCPACGTGFLAPVAIAGVGKKVPLIGDVTKMNSGQKLMLGIAISMGIIIGMLALLFIGGSVFG